MRSIVFQLLFGGLIALFGMSTPAQAQEDYVESDTLFAEAYKGQNTLFLEGLGNALMYSLNYDRIVSSWETGKLAIRAGGEYVPFLDSLRVFGLPVQFSYLNGRFRHFFEIGVGLTYFNSTKIRESGNIESSFASAVFRLGYRYQRAEGGLHWNLGIVPMINAFVLKRDPSEDYDKPLLLVGIGVGYTFKKRK